MPKEVVSDACDAVRGGRPRDYANRSAGAAAPSPWVAERPLMFPTRVSKASRADAPARSSPSKGSNGTPSRTEKSDATTRTGETTTRTGGSSCIGSDHRSDAQSDSHDPHPRYHSSSAGSIASGSADSCGMLRWRKPAPQFGFGPELATPPCLAASRSEEVSWEQSCEDHRAKVSQVKDLVRSVVGWGPQVGHLVDLRTGTRTAVTYWLRDDVRALCIFDHNDTQVRVYSCGQMERCEKLSVAPEVAARQFFLDLDDEAFSCGLMIVMERSAHSTAVIHQGHLGIFRAQLVLLCASRRQQKALLGAIQALTAELVLREIGSGSVHSAFRQESENRSEVGWHHLWPPDAPKSERLSRSSWSDPLLSSYVASTFR